MASSKDKLVGDPGMGWDLVGVRRLVDFVGVVKPADELWLNYTATPDQGVVPFEFVSVGHAKQHMVLHSGSKQALRTLRDVAFVYQQAKPPAVVKPGKKTAALEPEGFAGNTFLVGVDALDVGVWVVDECLRRGLEPGTRVYVELKETKP